MFTDGLTSFSKTLSSMTKKISVSPLKCQNAYAKSNPEPLKLNKNDDKFVTQAQASSKQEATPQTTESSDQLSLSKSAQKEHQGNLEQTATPETKMSKHLPEQAPDAATLKQGAKTPREIYEARLKEVADKPKRTIRRFESGTQPQELNILRPDVASVRSEAQKTQKAAFKRLNEETPKSDDRKVFSGSSIKPLELSEKHGIQAQVENRIMEDQYSKMPGAWID